MPSKSRKSSKRMLAKGSPDYRAIERADKIVEWALETGRNPTDTAGMDTDDEEWLGRHSDMEDYITSEYERRKEDEDEEEEEVDPVDSLLLSLLILVVSPRQDLSKYTGKTDTERLKKYIATFNPGQATPANLKEAVTRSKQDLFQKELKDMMKKFKSNLESTEVVQKVLGYIKDLGNKTALTKKKKTKSRKKSSSKSKK